MKSATVSAKSARKPRAAKTATVRKPRAKKISDKKATTIAAETFAGKAPHKTRKVIKINRADPFMSASDFEPTIVETPTSEQIAEKIMDEMTIPEESKIGTQAWAEFQAKQFLGETAVAWSATHDAKGVAYKAEQFRIGVPTTSDKGWEKVGDLWFAIEAGKSIRGTGASYTAAVAHARKRLTEKAAA